MGRRGRQESGMSLCHTQRNPSVAAELALLMTEK